MQTIQSGNIFPKLDVEAVRLELEKAKADRLILLEQRWRADGKSERLIQRLKGRFLAGFKYGNLERYTHSSWRAMIARCHRPNCDRFKWYGAIGIRVCDRWRDFVNFLVDMGIRPKGMTIERINHKGNYEPSNCVLESRAQQSRNKKSNVMIEYQGQVLCLKDWCLKLGLRYKTVYFRISSGWPIDKAFVKTEPHQRAKP